MQQGERQRSNGVMEKWSNGIFNTPALQHSNTPMVPARRTQLRARLRSAFALYEVLLGVAIFAFGVIALGRAVENCLNASTIRSDCGNSSGAGRAGRRKGIQDQQQLRHDKVDPEKCACEVDRTRQHAPKRNQSCQVNCPVAARWRPAVETDSVLCLSVRIMADCKFEIPGARSHCSKSCWRWGYWE